MDSGPDGFYGSTSELEASLSAAVDRLDSVGPCETTADLEPIGDATGDADVIGLGEASHGTREFFRFKSRLFRYLAVEHDVRLLGFEANYAAFLDVNRYVLTGAGTLESALDRDSIHPCFRSESVLDLLEWIRECNAQRPPEDRIRVHGFDVQHSTAAVEKLREHVETVGPAVESALDDLAEGLPDFSAEDALRHHLAARDSVVSWFRDAVETGRPVVEQPSDRASERLSRLVWLLEQGRRQFQAIADGRAECGANVRIRDSAMAAQVQWLLRTEPAARMAVWGHNAHLTRGTFAGGATRHTQNIPSLGQNLATLDGTDYYSLALVLGGGTVKALYAPEGVYRDYDIETPPADSIPDVLGRLDAGEFFLDVSSLDPDSVISEWLDSGPLHLDIAGGYTDSPVTLVSSEYRHQFDGIVFIEDTSPASW